MFEIISKNIDKGLANPYIMTILKVVLILYASEIAPTLPKVVSNLFANTWIKIVSLFLITYIASRDIQLAIILSFVFVTSTNLLSGKGALENFANFSKDYTSSTNLKLISPVSNIYPGCSDIKLSDITNLFQGDSLKMQNNVSSSFRDLLISTSSLKGKEQLMRIADIIGLPDSIEFTDENAPYIATFLVTKGVNINGICRPPSQDQMIAQD
jgi:hypothetical protein